MNVMNELIPANIEKHPQWLESASVADKLHYSELEQNLIASQIHLNNQLGSFTSVQAYARDLASQAIFKEYSRPTDPDTVMTSSHYLFTLDGCTFSQEDKRSLTDLLLHGLHDAGRRPQISLQLFGARVINPRWLEALMSRDVRADYGSAFREVYQRPNVLVAMKNITRDQLLFSAFSAKLQGDLSDANLQRVRGVVGGDESLIIAPLQLHQDRRPLMGLAVINSRSPSQDDWLLYAPNSPGGKDWYELPSLRRVSLDIGSWIEASAGRDYLSWRSHAQDREVIGGYLKQISKLPNLWEGISLAPTPFIGVEALTTLASNHRNWLVAQEESHTPYGYRQACDQQRQVFTRINCELRALRTIEVRQGGFISYDRFCHQLIKQRVEETLLAGGEQVAVDPDRIEVQISPGQRMTLTELIVGEVHFYATAPLRDLYPRFVLKASHPPISKLDIRHIASWSNTLRPGAKYIGMLRSIYMNRTHPDGRFKRYLHLGIMQRQMRVAIYQALFAGRVSNTHFSELMKVVDAFDLYQPQPEAPLGEAPDSVRHSAMFQLRLKDHRVVGAFVFRLYIAGKAEEYLYTPNAPDGCELRPFNDFVSAVKNRGLGDYFYDRMPAVYQRLIGTYMTDLEQLANYNEAPRLERNSRITDLNTCYDEVLRKVMSDVDEATQSLEEIITGIVFDTVVTAVGIISVVYPPVGIALGAALLTKELVQGGEAYSLGDRAKALGHFTDALIELAMLGYGGHKLTQVTKLQKDLIGLLGDVYTVDKFYAKASGQPQLHQRALEAIQEILDDPDGTSSKTILL
ncbi:hypothetical protein BK666_27825 [Pseudomonas frederiksbergensis]|uniref:Dermonecrotic toxin N-terminal domain-containing protein n=2 Tax=Pseudomonas frederiksbergensis TaxID=104087 RepID=A0A423JNK3_9PSED|nr:hypothetical protein BK666_27825 [Pseudomonas frederiksbergensis]